MIKMAKTYMQHGGGAINRLKHALEFTMAGRLSRFYKGIAVKHRGFTMAEMLIAITIIGIVAAITLPALFGNVDERTWDTSKKALQARMTQAFKLMPPLDGFGELEYSAVTGGNESLTKDTAAMTFVTTAFSKVYKINHVCDADHLEECGISPKINTYKGQIMKIESLKSFDSYAPIIVAREYYKVNGTYTVPYSAFRTRAVGLETGNGESVVLFYNPLCEDLDLDMDTTNWQSIMQAVCVNMIYDLNGLKGPNTVGSDIGVITVFNPTKPVVAMPVLYPTQTEPSSGATLAAACKALEGEYRAPTLYEGLSIIFNRRSLFGPNLQGTKSAIYSPVEGDSTRNWLFSVSSVSVCLTKGKGTIQCVKK